MSFICSNCNDRPGLLSKDGYCSSCQWVFEKGKSAGASETEMPGEGVFMIFKRVFISIVSLFIVINLFIFSGLQNTSRVRSFSCVISGGNYIESSDAVANEQKKLCIHYSQDANNMVNGGGNSELERDNSQIVPNIEEIIKRVDNLSLACIQSIKPIREIQNKYLSGLAISDSNTIDIVNSSLESSQLICTPDEYLLWYENEFAKWVNNPNY
jgi:hypothetical protein